MPAAGDTRKTGRKMRAIKPRWASRMSRSSSTRRRRGVPAGTPPDGLQDDEVRDADQQQKEGRNGRADHAATSWNRSNWACRPRPRRRAGRGQDHDRRVAEREEEADEDRPLPVLHELADDIVDGGDVVGVDGVAQPEDVGEEGRAQQHRMTGEHHPGAKPAPTFAPTSIA